MPISSSDILNLSHALKDICEVDCETCPLLTRTLRLVAQSNLLQAHLLYSHTLSEDCCRQNCHYYRDENSLSGNNYDQLTVRHGQRQEGFNLNYIHEHPRRNAEDYTSEDCESELCD